MLSWLKNLCTRLRPYAAHIDPPVFGPFATEMDAFQAAQTFGAERGAQCFRTSGTPSMVPIIPARSTYLAVKPVAFKAARLGTILTYRSPLAPDSSITHRAAARYADGSIIPSGDNNRYSEPAHPITPANLIGEVVGIFLVKPADAEAA